MKLWFWSLKVTLWDFGRFFSLVVCSLFLALVWAMATNYPESTAYAAVFYCGARLLKAAEMLDLLARNWWMKHDPILRTKK